MDDVKSDETKSQSSDKMEDESPLIFDKLYYETALIGKMMDVRRYDRGHEPPSIGMTHDVKCHAMPFLRRNLSYILEESERWKGRKKKMLVAEKNTNPRKRRRRESTRKEANGSRSRRHVKPSAIAKLLRKRKLRTDRLMKPLKSLDILWRYYQHRPRTHASPTITFDDASSEIIPRGGFFLTKTPNETKQLPSSLVPCMAQSLQYCKGDKGDKGDNVKHMEELPVKETLQLRGIERNPDTRTTSFQDKLAQANANVEVQMGQREGYGECARDESLQRKLRTRMRSSDLNKASTKAEKKFPPYKPFDGWKWRPPAPARNAFQLFCEWRKFSLSFEDMDIDNSFSQNSQDFFEEQELMIMWENISVGEYLYFKQEELWDKERYLHNLCTYNNARKGISMSSSELRAFVRSELNYQKSSNSGHKRLSPVIFHYLYHSGEETIMMHRESRRDRKCPFCLFDGASCTFSNYYIFCPCYFS